MNLLLVSDQIWIQSPSQFCSPNRAPDPSPEELAILSASNLDVPLSTMIDVNNTPEHLVMIPQTDPDASLYMDYDLNKTAEENEDILGKKKKMKIT